MPRRRSFDNPGIPSSPVPTGTPSDHRAVERQRPAPEVMTTPALHRSRLYSDAIQRFGSIAIQIDDRQALILGHISNQSWLTGLAGDFNRNISISRPRREENEVPRLSSQSITEPTPFTDVGQLTSVSFYPNDPENANIVRARLKNNPATVIIGLLGSGGDFDITLFLKVAHYNRGTRNAMIKIRPSEWDLELVPSGYLQHMDIWDERATAPQPEPPTPSVSVPNLLDDELDDLLRDNNRLEDL